MRAGRRVAIGALAALCAGLAPVGLPGWASATTSDPVRTVQVRSSYETATRLVSRDIGISVALPDGHAIWIFGDTGIFRRSDGAWSQTHFIDGSTAVLVKYKRGEVPSGGEYPGRSPSRFLPVPTNVYMPDGSGRPCKYPTAAFAARWPTGAAVYPANDSLVLVTYSLVCVTKTSNKAPAITAEGWGYEMYNWRTRRIAIGPKDVVKPRANGARITSAQVLGQPMFSGGKLTLFSSECSALFVACKRGQVLSVTTPANTSGLDHLKSYPRRALKTDGSAWKPLAVTVGRFPSGLRLIETTSINGTYRIYSAASVTGPWHLRRTGTLPGCPTKTRFCFALEGHPELSTPTQLFVSYKWPDSGLPAGHVVVSAIPD